MLCCLNIIISVERVLSLSLRHQSAASSRAAVLAIRSISILVCDVTIVSCVAEAQRSNCFTVTVCVFAIICVSGVDRWHLYKFFPRKICEKERNFVTASRQQAWPRAESQTTVDQLRHRERSHVLLWRLQCSNQRMAAVLNTMELLTTTISHHLPPSKMVLISSLTAPLSMEKYYPKRWRKRNTKLCDLLDNT